MIPKNATPAERILASLDKESSEAEDYSAAAIEVLPIAEIERMALEHVILRLNDAGLDYLAGLESVRELVAATAEPKKEDRAKPASNDEKRKIFKRHFLLGKLSDQEVDTVLAFSRVKRFPAGREIYGKGSPGDSMMLVLRGRVKMSSVSAEGKEIVLNVMDAGEIFGEIALLDGEERSADAVAVTDCELLVLHRRDFMPILEKHADICLTLMKILCQRLRQTSEQVEDVLFRHLESRIAKALLQLAESAGMKGASNSSADLHISQRELGAHAGGSRESVNKHLQSWHRQGLIHLSKCSIMIRDIGALRRLISPCWWSNPKGHPQEKSVWLADR
jgi:CRP/FNR family transcriptional regulator, cyclic AMP receptor protein